MKNKALDKDLIKKLNNLSQKIIEFKTHPALIECVLYEMLTDSRLNFEMAAYFVYNPDFYICKGISGLTKDTISEWSMDPWSNIDIFSKFTKSLDFNIKVSEKSFGTASEGNIDEITQEIKCCFKKPNALYHTLKLPNKNTGMLIYSYIKKHSNVTYEEVDSAISMLSFCPIS
jgi:hypothetical protein